MPSGIGSPEPPSLRNNLGIIPSSKDLNPNLDTAQTLMMLRECSVDEVRNADNLVTGYMDKDQDKIRSRSIMYKPYYDFKKQYDPWMLAIKDKFWRHMNAAKQELRLSTSEYLGLCRVRLTQINENFWNVYIKDANVVEIQSGSICRSFDFFMSGCMMSWMYRIHFCNKHNLNKYQGNFWRVGIGRVVLGWLTIKLLFLTDSEEDMRINYNYYQYKPPHLQPLPGFVQEFENFLTKTEMGSKRIIPEELRGEGRGRYDTIPERFQDERDWAAEREHGKKWEALYNEELKTKNSYKYSDIDLRNKSLMSDLATGGARHVGDMTNIPWWKIKEEQTKPEDSKRLYDQEKEAKSQEKQETTQDQRQEDLEKAPENKPVKQDNFPTFRLYSK